MQWQYYFGWWPVIFGSSCYFHFYPRRTGHGNSKLSFKLYCRLYRFLCYFIYYSDIRYCLLVIPLGSLEYLYSDSILDSSWIDNVRLIN